MQTLLRPAAAGLGLLSVSALAADRTAIEPGLWEFTHPSEVNGRPPVPDELLAKMPPEAMTGVIHTTMTQGAQTMTSHGTVGGRWLGAACGDVKPRAQD